MTKSKNCSKCRTMKLLTDFYKDKQNLDGLKGVCTKCVKLVQKQYQKSHLARFRRAYKKWVQKPSGKASRRLSSNKYRCNPANEIKLWARTALNVAVRSGFIVKPKKCSCCNKPVPSRRLHGHHEDYHKPYEVIWACSLCHSQVESQCVG